MPILASLIIPTFRRQHLLAGLLDQIAAQTSRDFETIIVDQTPERAEAVIARAARGQRLRYLHCSHASLPNARNIGAKAAVGEILIYIDDDVTLDAGFVAAHLAGLEDPRVSATAGRITGGYDVGAAPNPAQVGRFSKWSATVTRNFHGEQAVRNLDQLPGGNFAVRKEVYFKVGGFDLAAFGGRAAIGEETDFACRLRAAAERIDFVPAAQLHHDHAEEGGCREEQRREWTFWHAHNFATLALRYLPIWVWPVFLVNFTLRYLAHGLKAKSLRVMLAGWRGLFAPLFKAVPPPSKVTVLGTWQEYPEV